MSTLGLTAMIVPPLAPYDVHLFDEQDEEANAEQAARNQAMRDRLKLFTRPERVASDARTIGRV